MSLLTKELVGWILVITALILILTFIAIKFGADSPIKGSLLGLLQDVAK